MRSIPPSLIFPVAIGVVLRLALVIAQSNFQMFEVFYDAADSQLYRGLASEISERLRYWYEGAPTAYVTPGYPLFLSSLYAFNESTLFIGCVQAFLGAGTVGFVAATARRVGGDKAAWLAGGAAALYPHFLFWTGYVLTETLYLLFVSIGIWLTVRVVQQPTRSTFFAVGAGAAWGASVLVRPTPLLFVLGVIVIGMALRNWRKAALWALIGFASIWLPWVVRNAVTLDAFVPTSTETGIVLWQGNSPGATGGTRGYVDGADFDDLEGTQGMSEVEVDRAHREAALDWMQDNPGRVVSLVPKKLANMFRPTYEGASRLNSVVTVATYVPLTIVGLWGLLVLWSRGAAGRLIIALFGYHLLVHGLVTGMIRFRLPVELILCISAGVVGSRLLSERLRSTS